MTLAAKPEKDSWEIAEETAELISLHFEMRDMRAYLITAGIFMKHVRLAGCRPEDFGVIEKYLVPYREHSTKQAEWWLAHGRKYHYHVHRALANEMLNVVSSFLEHAQDSGRTLTDFGTNPFELAAIKAADPELKAVLMLADGLFRFPTPLGNHAASQHGLTALIIRGMACCRTRGISKAGSKPRTWHGGLSISFPERKWPPSTFFNFVNNFV